MTNVLEALIRASERAACIARSCTESTDQTLLVSEKGETEANARFDRDFKTIADVLAQVCAKAEISLSLPSLAKYVRGEECNEINGVAIDLKESIEETTELLSSLIPLSAAKRMAKAAHDEINYPSIHNLPDIPTLNPDNLGVWIDPIDATAEFIAGVCGEADADHGLPCVTVLIGAYLRSSGEPVVGVINQPFYNGGKGRIIWGVNFEGIQEWHDGDKVESGDNTVLISGAEKSDIIEKIKNSGLEVKAVPGAGHKLLKVATGEAAAYVVSRGTTFRWDTCAPHAILNAKGGGLVSFTSHKPIIYNDAADLDAKEYCNSKGIIAYLDKDTLLKIQNILN